jgi:NAD(P)-dependent dehydrogenase (short-subunit alcohol dehydrogenase family)
LIMKTCLITGASGGVATALATQLRRQDWRLALAGRDLSKIQSQADDFLIEADVSTDSGAELAVAKAAEAFGAGPDATVNCAGAILIAPIARTTEAQYRACLSANLDTAFFVSKAYASLLQKEKKPGVMVLFSSVAAGMGVNNHAAIAIAKGGIEALVRSLAADFSNQQFRINAISPGLTRTPLTEKMLSNEAAAKQIAAQYPLGRHGEADDIANLAAFLISDAAGWITGQIIAVDGGFSAVRPYVKST